jgi:hypothetical protein
MHIGAKLFDQNSHHIELAKPHSVPQRLPAKHSETLAHPSPQLGDITEFACVYDGLLWDLHLFRGGRARAAGCGACDGTGACGSCAGDGKAEVHCPNASRHVIEVTLVLCSRYLGLSPLALLATAVLRGERALDIALQLLQRGNGELVEVDARAWRLGP